MHSELHEVTGAKSLSTWVIHQTCKAIPKPLLCPNILPIRGVAGNNLPRAACTNTEHLGMAKERCWNPFQILVIWDCWEGVNFSPAGGEPWTCCGLAELPHLDPTPSPRHGAEGSNGGCAILIQYQPTGSAASTARFSLALYVHFA